MSVALCPVGAGVGLLPKRLILPSKKRREIGSDAGFHVGLFSSRENVPRYCSKFIMFALGFVSPILARSWIS